MECNRDEAIHAKIIAEKKLEDRDFAGAKKFVLKAQNLYPPLEGLSQMLTTLDVYIAAENKVSGEVDWYGVLGVTPSADDETIRKQYQKLALMFHPDKHKSIGADGAFKFLSEAWSLLSDKAKRLAYNQRRSSKGFQHEVQNQTGRPSAAPSANGFNNFTNRVPSKPKTQKGTVSTPLFRRTDTFWTVCNQCKMHYEYLKVYLNHTLLCPNCHRVFLAAEMAPPVNISNSSNSSSQRPHQNLSNHAPSSNPGRNTASVQNIRQGASVGPNSSKHTNSPWGDYSNVAGTGKTKPSIAAKAANVAQQANGRLKRGHEELQDSVQKGEAPFKKRALDGDDHNYGGKVPFKMSVGNGEAGTRSISGLGGFSFIIRPNSTRELTPFETRNMLMQKARIEICKKLSEWKSEAVYRTAEKNKVEQRKEEKLKNTMKCGAQLNGIHESSTTKRADKGKHLSSSSADGKNKEDPVAMPMNVPDPDFHDFDLDRTERSFGENQIWAAYDDDDGMPRFYALIRKIISRKPFKMRISWLNSKTNSEFGPMEWVGSGFYKTCGEFWIGKSETNKSLNSFSHKVKWTKGTRGILHIVPQKGDTWALYRNWSLDWNEHTPDEVIHKYDMVEVLDDYNEEQHGVSVTPLIKVSGFMTVFHTQLEHDKVMRIPKEEMFRFSHQVPNYMLTGQESQNAPKGCQELDPAATPLELLKVTTQVDEVPVMEKDGHVKIEVLENVPGIRVNETAEGAFENNEGTKEGVYRDTEVTRGGGNLVNVQVCLVESED